MMHAEIQSLPIATSHDRSECIKSNNAFLTKAVN
jgi:hypothetical protein